MTDTKNKLVAGIDEAGRGCLFGRVYSAAVIWNPEIDHPLLKDSKVLSPKNRESLYDFIIENAIDYGIGYAEAHEIDQINILQATLLSMHRSLDNLLLSVDRIDVDGTQFNEYTDYTGTKIEHQTIISGDALCKHISAASILAKVSHDRWIKKVIETDECYSKYEMHKGMGYGTKTHIDAINKYGPSDLHRKSFLKKIYPVQIY